jgi:hypothetical protein
MVSKERILSFFLVSLLVFLGKIDYFVTRLILFANEDFLHFSGFIISVIRSSEKPNPIVIT